MPTKELLTYQQQLQEYVAPGAEHLRTTAGDRQAALLARYPGVLPRPFRENPFYYDGNVAFMLTVDATMSELGYHSSLTTEQQLWAVSTVGLNDNWLDQTCTPDGRRDYATTVAAWDGINRVCYRYLGIDTADPPSTTEELKQLFDYYDFVLQRMPTEQQGLIAKELLSINLYQGTSLMQEAGMREYLGLPYLEPDAATLELLLRMQLEKGGMMNLYFAPFLDAVSDAPEFPDQPPTLLENWKTFEQGHSFRAPFGLSRYAMELGRIIQVVDDIEDHWVDRKNGVLSPQNAAPSTAETKINVSQEIGRFVTEELIRLSHNAKTPPYTHMFQAFARLVASLSLHRMNRNA